MPEPQKSRWAYWLVGGCLVIILIGVGSVVGLYYWGRNKMTEMVKEQADPATRETKAKAMLGATTLPPGYHAGVNISLGLARTARLSDKPISGDDQPMYNERGFVYNESIHTDPSEIEDYLAGKRGTVHDEMGTRLRTDEVLANGTISVNGQELHYSARRGEAAVDDHALAGLFTVVTIKCPDGRERWMVWFQKATAETPREGSVSDENAMRDFFGHFRICR